MRNFLLSDFLSVLSVPHTRDYTDLRFGSMPFKSLFGLSKLLEEYGVESEGLLMHDKEDLSCLTPPFLAHTPQGFLIVTAIGGENVQYLIQGVAESIPLQEFRRVWDGNVFLAFPSPGAAEPDYAPHARMRFFGRAKKVMLLVLAVLLFAWLFITNGIWRHASLILATVCDLLGLGLTYLLVQKSMKIKSRTAERVCGVLQEGGCDTVLETKASSFFGIFSWSEVGFSYFSVSLLAMLMFPSAAPWLAACNVCCLPFTVWSIWYQKFRAKAWCTLCVSVQATLWLLFACYISGGWLREVFPLHPGFFVLGATYAFVLLLINTLTRVLHPAAPADAPSTSDPVK